RRLTMGAIQLESEMRTTLRKNAVFAVFDDAALDDLASRLEMLRFRMGESIVTLGEPGDCAYIVFSGRCRVFKPGIGGKPVTLGSLGPGDFFGEQSLLTGKARSASVRASEDCVLFRISKTDFEGLLTQRPEIRTYLERFLQDRGVVDFLRSATFLGSLPPRELAQLLDRLKTCDFPAYTDIVRQGEPGDQMYLILSGEVEVTQIAQGLKRTLAHLSPGQYFGERSLLTRDPRSATVTTTPSRRKCRRNMG
ncbi:MAG: cyclic nucleotide-binding domain-containing protein, partial [Planctomycetota bacterium]|nr:cyclic nucleotide-binding domain-containing protein [Planctomycetota bacterium]